MIYFNEYGLLPPGTYEMTFDEIKESILIHGDDFSQGEWDKEWRIELLKRCEFLVRCLWKVDIQDVFLAGSFVTSVEHPNDLDGYYVVEGTQQLSDLFKKLNRLDPHQTWDLTQPKQ